MGAARSSSALRVFGGAVAVVTGAASGIGRAFAGELAERGASVVLADLQTDEAEAAAAALRRSGRSATAATLDVADAERVRRLVEDVAREHRRLDFVFNNAGIAAGGEVRDQKIIWWLERLSPSLGLAFSERLVASARKELAAASGSSR